VTVRFEQRPSVRRHQSQGLDNAVVHSRFPPCNTANTARGQNGLWLKTEGSSSAAGGFKCRPRTSVFKRARTCGNRFSRDSFRYHSDGLKTRREARDAYGRTTVCAIFIAISRAVKFLTVCRRKRFRRVAGQPGIRFHPFMYYSFRQNDTRAPRPTEFCILDYAIPIVCNRIFVLCRSTKYEVRVFDSNRTRSLERSIRIDYVTRTIISFARTNRFHRHVLFVVFIRVVSS